MNRILLILISFLIISFCAQGQTRTVSANPTGIILRFYPNPATTSVTFEFQKVYKGYSIQIFNLLGTKVAEVTNLEQRTFINLSTLTRGGVYIYQVRDNTGKVVESGKFQVSK